MALNYSVSLRPNPLEREASPKAYATAQMNGELSLKQLSRRVSSQTTVSRADVVAVLTATVDNQLEALKEGKQVDFGDLGKFRLQITSRGADSLEKFTASCITGINIQYVPGEDLKTIFGNLEFQPVASRSTWRRTAGKKERQSGGERPAKSRKRPHGCLDRRGRTINHHALIQKIMYHFKPHCYGKTKRKINLEHHYQSNYCSSHRHRRCAGYSKLYLIFNP